MKTNSRKIDYISSLIISDLKNHAEEYSRVLPQWRGNKGSSSGSLFRLILSYMIYSTKRYNIKINNKDTQYIFYASRNEEYAKLLPPSRTIIAGHSERKIFARTYSFDFLDISQATRAIAICLHYGIEYFLKREIAKWLNIMNSAKRTIVFTHEDTQPAGSFLVALANSIGDKGISVCIQHGYYQLSPVDPRKEGKRSQINLLWDINQAKVIGVPINKCYEIGLPYDAFAKNTEFSSIIFVGQGYPHFSDANYIQDLELFKIIASKLLKKTNLQIIYRPHPSEFQDNPYFNLIRSEYWIIDRKNKIELLNGQRSIFIGTFSSLLYEAKQTGHTAIALNIYESISLQYTPDLFLEDLNPENICTKIIDFISKNKLPPSKTHSGIDCSNRFYNSLVKMDVLS
jgi:hypothetical protein